jgi:predicted HTH domain antitoxin
VEITVDLPNDLERHPDPAREALEALVIAGYRSGGLTGFQASVILGFTSRFEFDRFLKDRSVTEHAYSREDLDSDLSTLAELKAQPKS